MNVDSSSSVNGGGMIYFLFLSSVNIDSSLSVNGRGMIYFLFLPSVKIGRTSVVNIDVCYLLATLRECW